MCSCRGFQDIGMNTHGHSEAKTTPTPTHGQPSAAAGFCFCSATVCILASTAASRCWQVYIALRHWKETNFLNSQTWRSAHSGQVIRTSCTYVCNSSLGCPSRHTGKQQASDAAWKHFGWPSWGTDMTGNSPEPRSVVLFKHRVHMIQHEQFPKQNMPRAKVHPNSTAKHIRDTGRAYILRILGRPLNRHHPGQIYLHPMYRMNNSETTDAVSTVVFLHLYFL